MWPSMRFEWVCEMRRRKVRYIDLRLEKLQLNIMSFQFRILIMESFHFVSNFSFFSVHCVFLQILQKNYSLQFLSAERKDKCLRLTVAVICHQSLLSISNKKKSCRKKCRPKDRWQMGDRFFVSNQEITINIYFIDRCNQSSMTTEAIKRTITEYNRGNSLFRQQDSIRFNALRRIRLLSVIEQCFVRRNKSGTSSVVFKNKIAICTA